ncbi:hypothetical protein [Marinicella meishanensis]|uniref:hypothetical protein n=1 Tax=Marinicella meishanensis TaxID=2873263 RepID=UPI001CBDA9A1|nr:hypothetical protein [Marinicella sp. NBU2979]
MSQSVGAGHNSHKFAELVEVQPECGTSWSDGRFDKLSDLKKQKYKVAEYFDWLSIPPVEVALGCGQVDRHTIAPGAPTSVGVGPSGWFAIQAESVHLDRLHERWLRLGAWPCHRLKSVLQGGGQ